MRGNNDDVVILAPVSIVSGCQYEMTKLQLMRIQVVVIGGDPRLALIDIYKLYFSFQIDRDDPITDLLQHKWGLKIQLIDVDVEGVAVNRSELHGMYRELG